MKAPLAWEYDLRDVLDIQATMARVIARPQTQRGNTFALREARDRLGRVVDELAQAGMDTMHETTYLHLFDALSYLTEALRTPRLDNSYFERAFAEIQEVFTLNLDD